MRRRAGRGVCAGAIGARVTDRGSDERVYLDELCSHDTGRDTYDHGDGIYQDDLALSLSDDGDGVLGATVDLQHD